VTFDPEFIAAHEFVEELLRTGLALLDLLGSLAEDLPEDAFPGEDNAQVLIEMVAGSCAPALHAIDGADCRSGTRLIRTVWEQVMVDLRAAAALAEPQGRS